MLIILATWEVEIGGSRFEASLDKEFMEPISTNSWTW
jgi:hypothetical protein